MAATRTRKKAEPKSKLDPQAAALAATINRKKGYEGVIVLGSQLHSRVLPRVSTGSLSLDVALGGGWVTNQWNEIVGETSHGKTVVALKTIAANQARDPNWTCLWIAAEHFVEGWAEQLGVDLDRLLLVDDNVMEVGYEIALQYMESQSVDGVVIDSLPAMVPDPEAEGSMYDSQVGLGARLTGKFLRKANKAMKRSLIHDERACLGLLINQFREKIGVTYGDNRTTPGGKHKDFEYFTRVEVRRSDWIVDDELREKIHTRKAREDGKTKTKPVRVGQEITCLVTKNKSAPAHRTAVFDFYFDDAIVDGLKFRQGDIDRNREVLAVANQLGVVHHKGGGIYVFGEQQWKGFGKLEVECREDSGLLETIADEVMVLVARRGGMGRIRDDDDPET